MPITELGQAVREAREAKGWSRATLAGHARIGATTVASIELYGRAPRLETVRSIARALGVPLADLLEEAA